jgi:hypothetical protein
VTRARLLLVLAFAIAGAAAAGAQFQRGVPRANRVATERDFDGRFHFCRLVYPGNRNGGSWTTDYPNADINMSIRLAELTRISVSFSGGQPNHLLVRPTDDVLYQCPMIIMTAPGSAVFNDEEAAALRNYLAKGGFLWADDFWGSEAWEWWEAIMKEVLPPPEYAIVDLTPGHPLFHAQFVVKQVPQIANIFHWSTFGDGRERGSDSPQANARAILDSHGRIMVLMTHNTDFGDSFEREGDDPAYFLDNSVPGYAFGINTLLYAMTH